MSTSIQSSESEIDDLINLLRNLDAEILRRVASKPAPKPQPSHAFCFMQSEPEPVAETFGTPLFTVLPPIL